MCNFLGANRQDVNSPCSNDDEEYEVCNAVGTARDKPPKPPKGFRKTWKDFWIWNTNLNWPKICFICSAWSTCLIGGHVHIKRKCERLVKSEWREEWIIPICAHCNNNYDIDYDSKYPLKTKWVPLKKKTAVRVPKPEIKTCILT